MEEQEHDHCQNRLPGCKQDDKRQSRHETAHPIALDGEIVDIGTALNGWPKQALEAALAARGRMGESERLRGPALNPKPAYAVPWRSSELRDVSRKLSTPSACQLPTVAARLSDSGAGSRKTGRSGAPITCRSARPCAG